MLTCGTFLGGPASVGWHLVAASLWTMTTMALASPSPTQMAAPTPRDSQHILAAAKSAQQRFERYRRRYLPSGYPSYERCDVRIGRFCLSGIDWSDADDPINQDEHPAIGTARRELIAQLDSAARSLPGDEWLAGQRVRYLVEQGDLDDALQAASQCRAAGTWWCRALAGFVYYADDDFAHSEAAYAEAVGLMSEEDRCEWNDLSRILDGALRSRYRKLDCSEREQLQRRILWLADPFHSIPGNELLAEHYSRQVHSALLKDAESPEGGRWGGDSHRVAIRYGWTYGWERVRTNSPSELRPSIRGHLAHGAKYFLPTANTVDHPTAARPADWDLEPHLPRAGHAPPYAAAGFNSLSHQLAAFRRGDSLIVVTTFELTDDSIPADAMISAAIVFTRDEKWLPLVVRETFRAKTGTLAATIPNVPHLMSYEVLAVEQRRAARARYGIEPSRLFTVAQRSENGASPAVGLPDPALSGVLLTDVRDSLPETLEAAIASARPNIRMRPGERLGLYWELYGSGSAVRRVVTSLTLTKRGKSFLKRIVGVFGLGSDKPPVSLKWTDAPPPDSDTYPRAVAVDLPDNLPNGNYELRLEVVLEDGRSMEIVKRIYVKR